MKIGKKKKFQHKQKLQEEKIRLLMLMIRTKYRYHKFLYYELHKPKITDEEFDKLEKQLEKISDHIERVYPLMFKIYQPKTWVGYDYKQKGA